MHLFKHFFKLLSRNRSGLIIYGIITLVMATMLITMASSEGDSYGVTAEAKSYEISYVDNDNSVVSQGLIDYLAQTNTMSDFSDKDATEISNIVFFAVTSYHFTIPEGFGDAVEAGSPDNSIEFETATGNMSYASFDIDNRINGYLNAYRDFRALGLGEEEAVAKAQDLLMNSSEALIVADDNEGTSSDPREIVIFNINQYFAYLLMGMMALGIGHTILITNKKELQDRNAVSPVPSYMTRLTNTIGLLVSGVVIWIIFMAFNLIYGGGTDLVKNYGWIIAINSFLCMLICCAITALLTNFIKTSNTLSMVTNILSLSMAFFCGVFVPMRFIGENVLSFSKFLPFYWTVLANNMTCTAQSKYAYDFNQVLICFGVQLLFAVAIAAVAIIGGSKRIIKA